MRAYVLVDDRVEEMTSAQEVGQALHAGRRMWVDLIERTEAIDRLLEDDFGLHPLVIEDIWSERSSPKIDPFERYLYIVAHGLTHASRPDNLDLWVLDLVVGERFVITQHRGRPPETLRELVARLPRLLGRGTHWVAHAILDAIIDRFLPLVDEFGARIERIDEEVLRDAGTAAADARAVRETLFALKRSLQKICRITEHQRRILDQLARAEFAFVPREAVPYFRDVADHFGHVAEHAETYRDAIYNAMDAYASNQSNRLNESMKQLTLISTCMLPLTFIASLYGMNFHFMPELSWRYGYPFALLLMGLVAVGIVTLFRRKGWF